MEKRVKAFFECDVEILEKKINHWLKITEGKLVEVQYDAIINGKDWGPSAMLVYIPQQFLTKDEEKSEKESKSEKSDGGIRKRRTSQRKQEGTRSNKSEASGRNRTKRSTKDSRKGSQEEEVDG